MLPVPVGIVLFLCYADITNMSNKFTIEIEQEVDGRWVADVQELPEFLRMGQ